MHVSAKDVSTVTVHSSGTNDTSNVNASNVCAEDPANQLTWA